MRLTGSYVPFMDSLPSIQYAGLCLQLSANVYILDPEPKHAGTHRVPRCLQFNPSVYIACLNLLPPYTQQQLYKGRNCKPLICTQAS
jgi:hypothetical protein